MKTLIGGKMNDKTKEPEKGNVVDFNILTKKPETMNFYDAIRQAIVGKKIQRISWPTPDYGVMSDLSVKGKGLGELMIYTSKDGKLHKWIINDGDINGIDWVIVW